MASLMRSKGGWFWRAAVGFAAGVSLVVSAAGCGDDDSAAVSSTPFAEDTTVILGAGEPRAVVTPDGDGCVSLPDGACARPQELCGDSGSADILVDADGHLIRVICYEDGGAEASVDRIDDVTKLLDAGTQIYLDDEDDGDDTDNLELVGEDVTIYGQGADVSVIGGNVKVKGDRGVLRGVRVRGNVTIEEDVADASLSLCVIEGNLHIKGDRAAVVDCVVFGNVEIDSDDVTYLSGNLAGADWSIKTASECVANQAFRDADGDGVVDDEELGEALTCP